MGGGEEKIPENGKGGTEGFLYNAREEAGKKYSNTRPWGRGPEYRGRGKGDKLGRLCFSPP